MITRFPKFFWPILIGWFICSSPVRADFDTVQFQSDLRALTDVSSRAIGSPGYEKARDYIRSQIQSLAGSGVELKEHTYSMMVPRTWRNQLIVGEQTVSVYPFFPSSVRLNTTPETGINGQLIYCGNGKYPQIPSSKLQGNIAVLEASSQDAWKTAHYFGAKAVLILGGPEVTHQDLRSHEMLIPINVPRFYLPDEALARRIRESTEPLDARLIVQSDWVRVRASNLYAYVPARDPLPPTSDRGNANKAWAALTIVSSYDASGLVPDYSPAAGQAVQPAAALGMLRDFARNPPRRPVLFVFTGGDSMNFQGTRQMLMAFGDPPAKWREVLRRQVEPALSTTRSMIEQARALNGDPTRLDVVKNRELIDRIIKIIETDIALEQDELFRLRVLPEDQITPETRSRMRQLESRQLDLGRLKYLFGTKPAELNERFSDQARSYLDRLLIRLGDRPEVGEGLLQQWQTREQALQTRIGLYEWLAGRINSDTPGGVARSSDPNPRYNNDRLIELMVGLDISDLGRRIGPMYWGRWSWSSSITLIQEHREWFDRQSRLFAEKNPTVSGWYSQIAGVVDFEPLKLTRTPISFLMSGLGLSTEMGLAWGVPAFSMTTLEDLRPRRDTPADTMDRLNIDWVSKQADAVNRLFQVAWADPKFLGQPEYRRNTNQFEGQVVSTASGKPIPDLPREGFLATYTYIAGPRKIPSVRWLPYTLGVRRTEVVDCDSEGRYFFEALPRLSDLKQMIVKVYRIEPGSGKIIACTDLGKQAGDIKQTVNLDQDIVPVKSVVFNSEEFTISGLYDPRFLQSLGEVQLMDARRNAEPQRFDAMLQSQMMFGTLEPGSRAYLLFRYGRIGNRIILLNMPQTPDQQRKGLRGAGLGYTVEQLNNLGPLAMVTARDFWFLNQSRIEEYRKAGVSSDLIDQMHQNAWNQLQEAQEYARTNDTPSMMRNATGAWADEARVYDAVQKMANDVIYAAIFLLLLSVPFAFCMERLLIGTTNIYKQIAYGACIFAVMAMALWTFHPAFKISSSPLIIILAFAIILMSIVVISVVYSRFDTELKRIRSGRGSVEGASFARASVLMSAVMLGIANMRRRKFRTALTAITVVLITFAVLCFTSASRYQSTISLPVGIDSQYPGLLLRQRGFRWMPIEIIDSLQAAYPGKNFVQRWWTLDAWDNKNQVHLVVPGTKDSPARVLPLQAMLGLSPGESQLSPIAQVVTHFDRLEKGEQNIIYLSQATVDQLKIKVGDFIELGGIRLQLAGTYDATDFDQRVLMLSGSSIAPLKYTAGALDASGRRLTDVNVDSLDLDASASAAEADAAYEHLTSSQFGIIPASVSRLLENSSLRTIGVRVADPELRPTERDQAVRTVVDDIVKRFALATFAGYSDGVKLVSASNLSSIGGGAQVAIPLAIGGLIIFNTMMGSIAERRREIHVYTSLGLAPLHVGALFVAEALTYGLIGSVFGYIIGQGAGTVLLKLGWLGNVTLNYSGTSAMLTLSLILLIVLLSALVPARLASKIAAPSIERSWKVPVPKDDQIIASLPFTINRIAAEGVVAYLAEFFEAHQEGSIGKFSAGKVEGFAGIGEDGKPTRGLKTVVWLTPFDLGVRQHLLLLIHPGEFEEIYEVQVILQRLSGDDGSWWRMNRSFLTELRKQFLQWRSLSPQRMKDYVEQSRAMFARVPDQVVTTDTGEEVRLA